MPVGIVSGKVACVVHLAFKAVDACFLERLRREVWTVPVALGHLRARQAQLAHEALRKEVAVGVKYQRADVIQRTAYWDVVVSLAWVYLKVCRVNSKLCRAVGVEHAPFDIGHGGHLLAAQADVAKIELLLASAEQLAKLRCVAAAVYVVCLQIFAKERDVHAHALGQDKHRAADRQHGIQVLNGSVEGEVAVARYAAVAVQTPLAAYEVYEVQKRLVLYHNTLGLACRPRSVNHVGEAIGRSHGGSRHGFELCRLVHCRLVNEQTRPGVLKHEGHSFLRVVLVQRHVGHACLMGAYHRRHEPLVAVHAYGDELSGLDALLAQVGAELVGQDIQLAVGQFSVAVNNRHVVGNRLHLTTKQVEPCFRRVIFKGLTLTLCQYAGLVGRGDERYVAELSFGSGHHVAEDSHHCVGHLLASLLAVHRRTGFYTYLVFFVIGKKYERT